MATLFSSDAAAPTDDLEAAVRHGDKLYVAELTTTGANARHHFAGEVTGMSGDIVRLDGYDFVYEVSTGNFTRKPWRSERIIRLDNAMVFYVLPADCDVHGLRHERDGSELIITDGGSFRLVDSRYSGR